MEPGVKEKEYTTKIGSADESNVALEASDVKLVKDKVSAGTAVDAYEEITKSEVTSMVAENCQ